MLSSEDVLCAKNYVGRHWTSTEKRKPLKELLSV